MSITYKVRGADGNEYGPADLEQLTNWLREGRVDAESEIMRSDVDHWTPARSYAELQSMLAPAAARVMPPAIPGRTTAAVAAAPDAAAADPATLAQLKSGASWFYWIAALSLINSISAASGSDWRFILGLGITQILDEIGKSFGGSGTLIVLALDLVVAAVVIAFGVFSHKRHTWAFIVGMVLFGLDGLIFLLVQDWLGVGFHIFALFCLFRGLKACRELNAG